MPEGSAARQSFIPEPQQETPDEMANLLAADKAQSAGELRTADANNNADFQPYQQQEPEEDNNTQNQVQEDQNTEAEQAQNQQAQLAEQEQAEIAIAMAASKQRQQRQIQAQRQKLEGQLEELEKELTDFKNSKFGGLLKIFQPRINILIDILIEQMKKQVSKLADEAKIAFYTGLIVTVTSLIAILTAMKFLAAFLDAVIVVPYSCIRLIIMTFYTCVIPILLVLISPIYVSFLVILFLIGKIPLLKGTLTKVLTSIIDKLKKQRDAWQVEVDKLKKKVALRKQIKQLKNMERQVAQRR
jgi:multidrug efflux pump subunit AcrA (membrane-fusion protein)